VRRLVFALGSVVVVVGGAALVLRLVVYDLARMDNFDMWPSCGHGAWILVNRRIEPRRGDMVAFELAGQGLQVRRVIALPGEKVAIRGGVPVVDGAAAERRSSRKADRLGRTVVVWDESLGGRTWPVVEDAGRRRDMSERSSAGYFVLADNRERTIDSRDFGPVAREQIRGVVQIALTHGDDP
jgi:signal peptidase I